MATRVNTKFVLILAVTLLAAGGIVGGLWVLQIRSDTTRNIRAGDALMARARAAADSGDVDGGQALFEQALKQYGRAASKDPAELGHLRKLETALASLRPTTQDRANELDAMRMEVLRHEVRYRRQDPGAHLKLITELYRLGRQFNQDSTWQEIADAADDMYNSVSPAEPQRDRALLYRGMAGMRVMGLAGLGPIPSRTATVEEIDEAEGDLLDYVAAFATDDLGWATLAESQLSIARQQRADGLRAGLAYEKAEETLRQALEAVPDGVEVARVHAMRLLLQRFEEGDTSVDEALEAAVDRLEELAAASDDPLLLAEVTEIVRTADQEEGLPRVVRLMRTYVNAHPEALYQQLQLAQLCYLARDHDEAYLDEAYETANVVIAAEPVPVGTLSRLLAPLKVRAAGLIVDVEYRRWMRADDADKPAKLQDIMAARDLLAEFVAEPEEDVTWIKAEGKIAAAKNDFHTAAARFERALKLAAAPDFETLWNAARCLEQIGQYGLACERLQLANRLRPGNVVVLAEKARLEYRVGRFRDARESALAVLELDPNYQPAQRLLTAVESADPRTRRQAATDPSARAVLQAQEVAAEGDLEAARGILLAAMDTTPDKIPLLSELIQVEVRDGNPEQALAYVQQALELQPNNQFLHRLRISLSIEDQIEALKQYVAEAYNNDADRAVHSLIQLRQLARRLDGIAERQAAAGDDAQAEETRARATVAREEAERFLAQATELTPEHPSLLDHLFNEALVRDDDQTAADLVALTERARAANADQAGGLIYRGRLEMYQQNYAQAVQTLTEATTRKHWSALAWRLLGRAHERLGNFPEALRAYDEAYTCNPNDQFAVRWYVTLLAQMGDQTRALRLLRSAQRTVPGDDVLRELRIQLEAAVGDPTIAIAERRKIYENRPDDRANAARLVALLSKTEPIYEHVRNERGELIYDAGRWALLTDEQRRTALEEVAARWQAESAQIISTLEASGGDSLQVAALRAETLRTRGDVKGGEQVLREYCDRHRDEQSVEPLIALGRYQASINHFSAAAESYKAARAYQSEDLREADHALADLLFNQNQWAAAEEVYRGLADDGASRNVLLRLAECYLKLQRYEDASAVVDRAVADGGQDFFTAMLSAGIADGYGDQLLEQERRVEAEQQYAEANAALSEAERIRPGSPLPHVRRAQRLVEEYDRTQRITLLDDAMLHLDRAEEAAAGAETVSRVRVEIHRRKNDVRGAIGELTRLLERTPDNVAARRLLVQIYAESGNQDRAMATIQEAITRNPTIALWHEAKGDMLVLMNRVPEAVVAFREAFELGATGARLAKYAETALVGESPAHADVAESVSSAKELVEGRPILRSLYARALSGVGRQEEALEQMRAAYGEHQQILDAGAVNAAGVVNWLRALQAVMSDAGPQAYEQFLTEVAGGQLDAVEQLWTARVWVTSGPEGLSRGIELLQSALAQCPADDTALRAQLELDMGQFQVVARNIPAAVEAFERALEYEPDNVLALNNVAYIYAEHLDDPVKALPFAERAVAVMPEESTVLDTLGWTYYRVGRFEEAEEYLRRATKARPTPENHLHLARVLFDTTKDLEPYPASRRVATARTYLRKAAELRPDEDLQTEIDKLAEEIEAWSRTSGQRPGR